MLFLAVVPYFDFRLVAYVFPAYLVVAGPAHSSGW